MKKRLEIMSCLVMLFIMDNAVADSISYNISSSGGATKYCNFMDNVVVDVAYELKSRGTANIILLASEDGQSYSSIGNASVSRGAGNVTISGNPGGCAKSLRVQFQ